MEEEPKKNGDNGNRDPKTGRFIDGNEGGPGRPRGAFSLTDAHRHYYEEHPEKLKIFLKQMRIKQDFWKKFWDKIDPNAPEELMVGSNPELPFTLIIKKDGEDNQDVSPPVSSP